MPIGDGDSAQINLDDGGLMNPSRGQQASKMNAKNPSLELQSQHSLKMASQEIHRISVYEQPLKCLEKSTTVV